MVKTEKTTKTATAAKTTMATKTGEFLPEEDRKLSGSEAMVMKAVWDAGEDISVPDLMIALKEKYGKDYARTTVQTFLLKMIGKGFVQIYRRESCPTSMRSKARRITRRSFCRRRWTSGTRGTRHSWSPVCSEPGR